MRILDQSFNNNYPFEGQELGMLAHQINNLDPAAPKTAYYRYRVQLHLYNGVQNKIRGTDKRLATSINGVENNDPEVIKNLIENWLDDPGRAARATTQRQEDPRVFRSYIRRDGRARTNALSLFNNPWQ